MQVCNEQGEGLSRRVVAFTIRTTEGSNPSAHLSLPPTLMSLKASSKP